MLDPNTRYHVGIWIQKQRMRLYINETKVMDLPRVMPVNYTFNSIRFLQEPGSEPMVTNIRLASGLPDTRSKLITDGKLVTYGIYFEVNSDKVKPELLQMAV